MLLAIRTIAKHRILADGMGDSSNDKEIVSAASRVLVEWPKNFIALLEDIGHSFPADISGGVGAGWRRLLGLVRKQGDGGSNADRDPESCVLVLRDESLGSRVCRPQDHP